MSSEPNQVGSPHDKANAEFMLGKFKEWGWDARIETFYVLYPTPKSESLELVAPVPYKARLLEPPVEGDRTSDHTAGGLPPYNIYGADGDVTADLVYVNYGTPEDYVELERRGVDVRGKIVIARYGACWRGLKPKLAQEHGAVGCIIYSDPHEDGYWSGDVYPKGGFRPEDGVQRGSVADITLYPGDPLTPGRRLDEGREAPGPSPTRRRSSRFRCSRSRPPTQSRCLRRSRGRCPRAGWRGAIPITYHIGPGPAKVHLAVASDWDQKPIYDVIAVMQGSAVPGPVGDPRQPPRRVGLRGVGSPGGQYCRHGRGEGDRRAGQDGLEAQEDARLRGMGRGGAGTSRLHRMVRDPRGRAPTKAVLYVNSDTNGRGFLFVGGSHSFQHLVNEVAGAVVDPETGASVLDRLRAKIRVDGTEGSPGAGGPGPARGGARRARTCRIEALGSGSDYSSFLQHLGVSVDQPRIQGRGR